MVSYTSASQQNINLAKLTPIARMTSALPVRKKSHKTMPATDRLQSLCRSDPLRCRAQMKPQTCGIVSTVMSLGTIGKDLMYSKRRCYPGRLLQRFRP